MNSNLFNSLLYDSLDKDEMDSNNICLISQEPLDDDHIALACKHKFNYVPIFNEIANQKKLSHYETTKLSLYQIKCPYCRNIQNGLIPTNKNYPYYVKRGVNIPKTKCYFPNKCGAIFKSGKNKGNVCNKPCFDKFCKMHNRLTNKISDDKNVILCEHILKSGKRKNLKCGKKCKSSEAIKEKKCLIHLKATNKATNKII